MPEERVRIYLFDYDRDSFNDQLSDVFSDKEGFFKIEGYETEFFPVEPFIRILHNCNLKGELKEKCYYRFEYKIPRRYVSWGKKPKVYHSSGTIELSSAKTSEMICGP
uniref:Transthyretin-like family protein n=1 Tax=Parastrongyloides trichosuri TaxID=131310 RepID=A0A0N5A2Q8_PARTI